MLEPSPRLPAHASSPNSVPSYGRPRRGTPEYAAAIRQQVARLAARHAATVATRPLAPAPPRTVLVWTGCPVIRAGIREALAGARGVRLVEALSRDEVRHLCTAAPPALLLVDQLAALDLRAADRARTVLMTDAVPRSGELPCDLAGVLARPFQAERVQRYVLSLLEATARAEA